MNDSEIIVQAMRMGVPKRRRKVMREIEPSPVDTSGDAISKMASKPVRKKRAKALRYWEAPEFLMYLVQALSNHAVVLARVSSRDREDMAYLYDELIRRVGDRMSNTVMRDYIDWWAGTHACRTYGSELYARSLSNDRYLDQFVGLKFNTTQTFSEPELAAAFASAKSVTTHDDVDAKTLYQMGGLPLLLRAKGIVIAAQILREKEDNNWLMRLSQTLHDFPKDAVFETIERTTSGAPYPSECMVDFVSIARPANEFHGIREYSNLNYRDFFRVNNAR